jgi:hypothetical protein
VCFQHSDKTSIRAEASNLGDSWDVLDEYLPRPDDLNQLCKRAEQRRVRIARLRGCVLVAMLAEGLTRSASRYEEISSSARSQDLPNSRDGNTADVLLIKASWPVVIFVRLPTSTIGIETSNNLYACIEKPTRQSTGTTIKIDRPHARLLISPALCCLE